MATLFEAAAQNPAILQEIFDAVGSVAGTGNVDALTILQRSAQDPAFRDKLAAALRQIASSQGLTFDPQAPASLQTAQAALAALQSSLAGKSNPTQIPVGMPIALLFIGLSLMFAPSVFKTVGGTLFGEGIVAGVEGIETFQ